MNQMAPDSFFLLAAFLTILLVGALVMGVTYLRMSRKLELRFGDLAARALLDNNQEFLRLAEQALKRQQEQRENRTELEQEQIKSLVQPLGEALKRYEVQVRDLETKREQAYGGLRRFLESVADSQVQLKDQTGNLIKALRRPHIRGHWGEMTLNRVIELAGMVEHCDFETQHTIDSDQGRSRPDLIVRLPGDRQIVIDSKVPLEGYLDALEEGDENQKRRLLQKHAQQLRKHVAKLASKAYWSQLTGSPEFVVLFIPLESLYSIALEQAPSLFEESLGSRVILATPTTLISLLKTVSYSWKQETLTKKAEEISLIGKELYERMFKVSDHLSRLGVQLERAVNAYNETAGSFERRLMVKARRFKELGISSKHELEELKWVEKSVRHLQKVDEDFSTETPVS